MLSSLRSKNSKRRIGRLTAVAAAVGIAMTTVIVAPASADDVVPIPVSYKVTGSTTVAKTGSAMTLGPGALNGNLLINNDTGAVGLSADLTLPPATANISLVSGIFKIKATVTITPTAPITGSIANGDLNTHATATMAISDIWVGPLVPIIPLPTVPGACKTVTPIDLNLTAKNVDIFAPSFRVTGTYTIPSFNNCFIADIALGALVSGSGNTIALDLASNNS
ncbi:MAG: hypothetical protein JWQ81_7187 [Amycolatopsis sp.]|jgi:hypothetical protein|uniref:hypothetical protein n=1 Tax=Amycolatopsis sp. TaxID=37632 RepID=UPI002620EB56|nr:hypothetical protein [Amycolatopsis sp.]MCU1686448.1 hypothetical protein [Amycolatopsis sp.]